MADLDLKSFGAVADGKKDNAAIINYAAQVAKAEKSRLHVGSPHESGNGAIGTLGAPRQTPFVKRNSSM